MPHGCYDVRKWWSIPSELAIGVLRTVLKIYECLDDAFCSRRSEPSTEEI